MSKQFFCIKMYWTSAKMLLLADVYSFANAVFNNNTCFYNEARLTLPPQWGLSKHSVTAIFHVWSTGLPIANDSNLT